jgi:mRNA-degrading endonuclease YafQ of YafQ-DinJ toxin-antitoxin module
VTGSNPFSVKPSDNFKRSFKKLAKTYGKKFVDIVAEVIEALIDEPYPTTSRSEPLPSNIKSG